MGNNSCVAIYRTRERLKEAVRALRGSGSDMAKVSIVGRPADGGNTVSGLYVVEERIRLLESEVPFWKSLAEELGGMAWLVKPSSRVVVGALVSLLERLVEGGKGGSETSLTEEMLYTVGATRKSARCYEKAIDSGRYLTVVHGSLSEVEQAHQVLLETSPEDIAIHLA